MTVHRPLCAVESHLEVAIYSKADGPTAQPAVMLEAVTYVADATPEDVLASIQGFAARRAPVSGARWLVRNLPGALALELQPGDGPLASMTIALAVEDNESIQDGLTPLQITAAYTVAVSPLAGARQNVAAQRTAMAMREEIIAVLRGMRSAPGTLPANAIRQSPRYPLVATAKLTAGRQAWHARLLNVSAGGMALIVTPRSADAASDASLLLAAGTGEVEWLVQGRTASAACVLCYALPMENSVRVGVRVSDTHLLQPLVLLAQAQAHARPR